MTEQNGQRYQAWKDKLPIDRLERVIRIEEMPPQMAIAYVYSELMAEIEELRKPMWKQALTPLALAGAVVAGYFGDGVPRP